MKNFKIVLVGGGTGGPVAPLLAVAEKIREKELVTEFLFIGTKQGKPEKEMIKDYGFIFKGIFAGKLRRYFSWRNLFDPFLIFLGFLESLIILRKFKPDLIISAGSYLSVPVVIAGWFLRIPSLIHQQDIIPSLSNKILIPFVKKITVSFKKSFQDFPFKKTIYTGNPIRSFIKKGERERSIRNFNLEKKIPTLLVIGGGTGAKKINELIWQILSDLIKFCQIIHLTGRNKLEIRNWKLKISSRYHFYEFLTNEMADVYAAADLVISRAGMNVLTELSILGKPAIIIPIPNSHQETNAYYFQEKKAAVVLSERNLKPEKFLDIIQDLLNNQTKIKFLSENIVKIFPHNAAEKIVEEIFKLC